MSALIGLQCHLCKSTFPAEATYVCEKCLGPLEPLYDYTAITLTREEIAARPKNMWRYRELMPLFDAEQPVTLGEGWTPLLHAPTLGKELGLTKLYVNTGRDLLKN